MSHPHVIEISINGTLFAFDRAEQTGRSIKERAGIPADHVLCLDLRRPSGGEDCKGGAADELHVIDDCNEVALEQGQKFLSHAPEVHHGVTVAINKKPYEFRDPHQTGRSIKERGGIPITDVLFLQRPVEDEVIGDDTKITLKHGDCFHSSPPANYGNTAAFEAADVGYETFETHRQPDGWTLLVVSNYPVPRGYTPRSTKLLVKLPPMFPDAAPDMFWLNPPVRTAAGCAPQGTSTEQLLSQQWQRFSWHLVAGAWRPGTSTLRDFMRCVRARLEKCD